jgi:hypothetical protein
VRRYPVRRLASKGVDVSDPFKLEHQLDPTEAEYVEVTMLGSPEPLYLETRCLHRHKVPVDSVVTGEVLAYLCPRCDRQLGA